MRHTNYDEVAATYDRRYAEDDYSGIERALIDFIGSPSRHVLEVGCGTGHWLGCLRSHNIEAAGLDLSSGMLTRARAKLKGGLLARARAESLPFSNGRFDGLFSINAHHHFADKRQALQEARRVLRPGGSIMTVALDPHTGTDQWWVYDYFEGTLEIDRQRYPSCTQIREWMIDAGFVDTFSREVQHIPGDMSADAALQSGMVYAGHTSQLAVLTSAEFSAGIARIQAALARDSTTRLSADLRVYATYGFVPR